MTAARTAESMSTGLLKVIERAKRDPQASFFSLAHLIDEAALVRAFERLRKDAAAGVDGTTKEQYGRELADNVRALHKRMREGRYRHQPIRRVHIPKGEGKTRPIGVSSIEDKIVQSAITEVLSAVYEPIFSVDSYGFRPGRSAHDAIRALNEALLDGVSWVLEADIESFFDSIDRKMLTEMLQQRVADGALLRLIGKCLHVGVLDGEEFSKPDEGTVQGSALSPMLGNIYLHHVLDQWIEREVRPRLRGKVFLVRYADDFVLGFEREDDARRVMEVLPKRFERHGLRLHPEKTHLLPFARPSSGQTSGKGPASFDFLGFTTHWVRRRNGRWMPGFKTRKARLRRAFKATADWCRRQRHLPVKEQRAALARRLNGHFNYFGVNGNLRSLQALADHALRTWKKWLSRRSQRAYLTWTRFKGLLRQLPLPTPSIRVQIWKPAR